MYLGRQQIAKNEDEMQRVQTLTFGKELQARISGEMTPCPTALRTTESSVISNVLLSSHILAA